MPDPYISSRIFSAIDLDDAASLERLLRAHPNVHFHDDRHGHTPLAWSLLRDRPACFDLLLRRGSSVSGRAYGNRFGGQTLLMVAMEIPNPSYPYVDRLLAAGSLDPASQTPSQIFDTLKFAIQHRSSQVLRHFLAAGFDLPSGDWRQLLLLAAQTDSACLSLLLPRFGSLNWEGRGSITPLMSAASAGRLDCLQLLLDAGASLDFRNARGRTALMAAFSSKRLDSLRFLLSAGAAHPFDATTAPPRSDRFDWRSWPEGSAALEALALESSSSPARSGSRSRSASL